VATLERAAILHAGRPTVAIVGAGALPVGKLAADPDPAPSVPAQPATSHSDP
jgi:uroporphyrin-III C-methyltransferase